MNVPLERILLVEDDRDIRMVARTSLELVGGFQVRACESGEEALQAVAEFLPQLMLLDVMMPGMDGPTVLKRLREQPQTAKVPAIFFTAKMLPEEVRRCALWARFP